MESTQGVDARADNETGGLVAATLRMLPRNRYAELDGLRGIAIALVVVFHCRTIARPVGSSQVLFTKALETGWIGVDLFFVLSGFLITGILLATAGRPRYFRNFYIRRTLRIFPLYYGFLALILVASLLGIVGVTHTELVKQLWYWAYLQNWLPLRGEEAFKLMGHFWSLAVEEQFYLVWPLLILLATRLGAPLALCVCAIIGASAARFWFVSHGVPGAYFLVFCRADALGFGALVAVLLRAGRSAKQLTPAAFGTGLACALAIVLLAAKEGGFYGQAPEVLKFGLLPLACMFAAVVVLALGLAEATPFRKLLRLPFLRVLGGLSYGIYVLHYPLIVTLRRAWPHAGGFWLRELTFVIGVGTLSTTLAWLSYRYFEKPLLQLKERLAPLPKDDAIEPTASSKRRVSLA